MALTRAELIAAGIEIPGSSSAESFIPTGNTVPTNGLYLEDVNRIGFATNSAGRLFIDSNGNIQHGVIPRFNVKSYGNVSKIPQIQSARVGESVFSLANFDIGFEGGGAIINLSKSRSTNPSAYRWLSSGQTIGQIVFQGDNGFGFTPGAAIVSSTDTASGITAPNMVAGTSYKIYAVGTSDFTLVGASSNDVGTVFTATGPTTGSGEVVPENGTMPANIRFYTTPYGASAPSERLRITSAGLVGIGTTSPDADLHIRAGVINDSYAPSLKIEYAYGQYNIGDTQAEIIFYNSDNSSNTQRLAASIKTLNTDAVYGRYSRLGFFTASGTTTEAERMSITKEGNVGIGVTSPTGVLHAVGGDSSIPTARLVNSGAAYSTGAGTSSLLYAPSSTILDLINTTQTADVGQLINFNTYDSAGYSGAYFGAVGGNVSNGPAHLVFGRRTDTQTWTESARIDSSGRLLVGAFTARTLTVTPQIMVETVQTSTGDRGITIINGGAHPSSPLINFGKHRSASVGGSTIVSANDYTGALIFNGSDGTNFIQSAVIAAQVDGTPGTDAMPGRLVFSTNSGTVNASPTPRMTIKSDGKVGIGTQSPAATLHVEGSPEEDPFRVREQFEPKSVGTVSVSGGADTANPPTRSAFGLSVNASNTATGSTEKTVYISLHNQDPSLNNHGTSSYITLTTPQAQGTYGTGQFDFYIRNGASYTFPNHPTASFTYWMPSLMTIMSNGNVGIGVTTPSYRLQLNADSAAKPSTNTWTITSDERIKEDIELANLDICYDAIKNIPLKRFKWKDEVYSEEQVTDRHKLGWIAQDVQAVFPKAVSQHEFKYNKIYEEVFIPAVEEQLDEDGNVVVPAEPERIAQGDLISEDIIPDCLNLNSDQIYAAMYGAIQKLIDKVETLESELAALKAQ